jgi:branched-chain amino acid transport system substrate-binding protein
VKRRVMAAVAAGLLTALSACGGSSDEGSSNETIKIGGWFPLSGAVAASGIPQEAGVRALVEAVNEEGGINGRKIEFLSRDNAYDPQQTLQIARQQITQDKVVAFLAPNGTAATEATFPFVLEQNKVPIFGTFGGLSTWYEPVREGLFGTQALYEDQALLAADWAIEEGAKNAVILRSDPGAFATVGDTAAERFERDGVKVSTVVSKFGSTDFGPYVSEIKKSNPDTVLIVLAAPEAAAFLKEAKLQGLDAQMYGYVPSTSDTVIKLAEGAAEGFRGISLTVPTSSTDVPEVATFIERLKKYAPKVDPTADALTNYASAMVFVEILKKIDGEITAESIRNAVENSGVIETGLVPPMEFSKDNHLGTRQAIRVEVQDNKLVPQGDFVAPKE